jgi:hypothetical protein
MKVPLYAADEVTRFTVILQTAVEGHGGGRTQPGLVSADSVDFPSARHSGDLPWDFCIGARRFELRHGSQGGSRYIEKKRR